MGFIIEATNIETNECVLYAKKSQKSVCINGVKYKYFVPKVDWDLKVYSDIPHCNIALAFLKERLKQPFKSDRGIVEWRDVWAFEIIEVCNPDIDEYKENSND